MERKQRLARGAVRREAKATAEEGKTGNGNGASSGKGGRVAAARHEKNRSLQPASLCIIKSMRFSIFLLSVFREMKERARNKYAMYATDGKRTAHTHTKTQRAPRARSAAAFCLRQPRHRRRAVHILRAYCFQTPMTDKCCASSFAFCLSLSILAFR